MADCKAVAVEVTGRLGEIRVPCLLVTNKSGGNWNTLKASPALDHLAPTKVVEVLIEGWYITEKGKKLEFFLVGDVFNMKNGTDFVTGPYS